MKEPIKVKTKPRNLIAFQWNGSDLPGDYEGFESFGYFEHENGYDLEDCDCRFILENGRKVNYVRLNDYILKDVGTLEFSTCSEEFFKKHLLGIL